MAYSGQREVISSGQDIAQLKRDAGPIPVVRAQACGVSPEVLAEIGQDAGAWVEFKTLVTANRVRVKMQPSL